MKPLSEQDKRDYERSFDRLAARDRKRRGRRDLRHLLVFVFLFSLIMVAWGSRNGWGACEWSWCTDDAPKRTYVTDTARVKVGDLYQPTPTRRTQIRDKNRKIIGYIESNGNITDTRRRIVGHVAE